MERETSLNRLIVILHLFGGMRNPDRIYMRQTRAIRNTLHEQGRDASGIYAAQ